MELGGVRVWIDALHDTRVPGFSTLDSHLLRRLWPEAAFQSPDAIVIRTVIRITMRRI